MSFTYHDNSDLKKVGYLLQELHNELNTLGIVLDSIVLDKTIGPNACMTFSGSVKIYSKEQLLSKINRNIQSELRKIDILK